MANPKSQASLLEDQVDQFYQIDEIGEWPIYNPDDFENIDNGPHEEEEQSEEDVLSEGGELSEDDELDEEELGQGDEPDEDSELREGGERQEKGGFEPQKDGQEEEVYVPNILADLKAQIKAGHRQYLLSSSASFFSATSGSEQAAVLAPAPVPPPPQPR